MDAPDPTRVREQPALTRSTGRIWLVVGGAFALVSLGLLVPMTVAALPPIAVPPTAAAIVVALYVAMLAVRVGVRTPHRRLAVLAVLMLVLAAVALAAVLVVAFAATV